MADTNETSGSDSTKRTRLIVDIEDIVSKAAQHRASKESVRQRRRVTKSEVVSGILREGLAPEIAELQQDDVKPPTKPKKKP